MYIRYNPLHEGDYLRDASGKEITEISDWIEVEVITED
jgi:hypothetical protein